jgi:hypothetical protein
MPSASKLSLAELRAELPPDFRARVDKLLADAPAFLDRTLGVKFISAAILPTSAKRMEKWPLAWKLVSNRCVIQTELLVQHALWLLHEARPAAPVQDVELSFAASRARKAARLAASGTVEQPSSGPQPVKRPRGRPRKVQPVTQQAA